MSDIKVGDLVRLIGDDGFMPPLGSIGTVESAEDEYGDHDVLFIGYPCPNPPGTTWVTHKTWIKRIDPSALSEAVETNEEITA